MILLIQNEREAQIDFAFFFLQEPVESTVPSQQPEEVDKRMQLNLDLTRLMFISIFL